VGRDDFTPNVRSALKQRAGYKCSFPGCNAATEGPSESSPTATSSVGVACHITAAAPGGCRYDPTLTPEERRDIANGIWMCQTHGRMIDNDAVRFPVATLRSWKVEAEQRAKVAQGKPSTLLAPPDHLLAQFVELLTADQVNEKVGVALETSGADAVLGRETTDILRDFLIEVAKNALEHGRSSCVTLSVEAQRIVLIDNGAPFDPCSLLSMAGRGGALATRTINERCPELLIGYERDENLNRVTVTPAAKFVNAPELMPCVLHLTRGRRPHVPLDISPFAQCGRVFIVLPRFFSISDAFELTMQLRAAFKDEGQRLVFVVPRSSQATMSVVQDAFPFAQIRTTELAAG